MERMNDMAQISFESAYRQLSAVDRAFVDSFVARIELTADTSGRELGECLASIDPQHLPPREQTHLSSALVRAAVSERIRDLTEAQNISPRRLLKRAAAIAFASLDHFYDPAMRTFDFARGTPEQRAAVKKVKVTETRNGITTELELKDDVKMLMAFMTQQGLLNKDGDAINPKVWDDASVISDDVSQETLADMYTQAVRDGL